MRRKIKTALYLSSKQNTALKKISKRLDIGSPGIAPGSVVHLIATPTRFSSPHEFSPIFGVEPLRYVLLRKQTYTAFSSFGH
jgi:hypothetical protein